MTGDAREKSVGQLKTVPSPDLTSNQSMVWRARRATGFPIILILSVILR
jgi:hypothetical protein